MKQYRIELERRDGTIGAVVFFEFEETEYDGRARVEGEDAAVVEEALSKPGVGMYHPDYGSLAGYFPERWEWVSGVVSDLVNPFQEDAPFFTGSTKLLEDGDKAVA